MNTWSGQYQYRGAGDRNYKAGTPKGSKSNVMELVSKLVSGLRDGDFVTVIQTINNPSGDEQKGSQNNNIFRSDTQGKTALYKLMQTVRGFSEDCKDDDDSRSCSKAVAKIYASLSAVASRQSRSDVLKVIKGVFEGYVIRGDGADLKKRLNNFLVFLELVVANVR